MFIVSYYNENGKAQSKGGFKSDKEAYEWVIRQKNIIPVKMLVWSEMLNACRTLFEF